MIDILSLVIAILSLVVAICAILCSIILYCESMFRSLFVSYISNENLVGFYNKLETGKIQFELFNSKTKSKEISKQENDLDSFLAIMNAIVTIRKSYFKNKLIRREAILICKKCKTYVFGREDRWTSLRESIEKYEKTLNREYEKMANKLFVEKRS